MKRKLQFFITSSISGSKTWFLALALAGSIIATLPLRAASGLENWFPTPADKDWTNKPISQIKAQAEQGQAAAQYYFGRACFFGEGVSRDVNSAFRWIRRAAEQGYVQAQFMTSRIYFFGVAEEGRDFSAGFTWAQRAADQGHADAMASVGMSYGFGEGTSRNPTNARTWLLAAFKAGSFMAPQWLGDFCYKGEGGTAKPTNYSEAMHWYEVAASNNSTTAAMKLANMWTKGLGAPPDFQKALVLVQRVADGGDPDALELLHGYYAMGLAEPRRADDKPINLLQLSGYKRASLLYRTGEPTFALRGVSQALANRYRYGIGTARDYIAAAQWVWQTYQVELGFLAQGKREKVDYPFAPIIKREMLPVDSEDNLWHQAVRLVDQALEQGQPQAFYSVAELYRDGSSLTPQRPLWAWAWFARSAELGHAPAQAASKSLESKFSPDELEQAKRTWIPRPKKSGQ